MRIRQGVGLVSIAWLAAACQSPLVSGAGCSFHSDCAAPLVCVASRCRSQCQEARDCPYPLDCVKLAEGLGACQVHEDDACREGANDCAAPLVCRAGRCRQECEETNECALGMTCGTAAAACERPPVIAGVCDPLSDQGCAATETCALVSGVASCVSDATGSGTPARLGETCTSDDACGPGLVCPLSYGNGVAGEVGRTERRCLRVCGLDPATSCGLGSVCEIASLQYNGWAQPQVPAGLGVCTEICDPIADVGCPAGETCLVLRASAGRPTFCSPTHPGTMAFVDCQGDYECSGHALCDRAPGDRMPRVCRPICDPAGAGTCPSGSHCELADTLDTGRDYGLCVRDGATP
ncbi:MAG: hypothetical protein U0234_20320 [Sandaracinus sp.]